MTAAIVLASSVLAVVLAIALAREIRLRRALQKLLSRLLTLWRTHAKKPPTPPYDAGRSDIDPDRV
jgi:hypothetical protein